MKTIQNRKPRTLTLTTKSHFETRDVWRSEWIAVSYRPDPITSKPREIVIGKGYSSKTDTINICLESLPLPDPDNFCRICLRISDDFNVPEDAEWPKNWTVLSYRNDKNGNVKKNIIGSAWVVDDEIVIYLDSIPIPNHNIECWITLKPRIFENDKTDQR